MNNSQRTKLVAQGIALYAAFMDLPGNQAYGHPDTSAWFAWMDANPRYAEWVMQNHIRLFDELNLAF